MTHDFIDDLSDALEKEKRGYLIAVHSGADKPLNGVHIRTNLDHWAIGGITGITKENDVLLAIAAALGSSSDELLIVLNDTQRQLVLGALDTLGVKLADKDHTWSAGEREIFEQATKLLTKDST